MCLAVLRLNSGYVTQPDGRSPSVFAVLLNLSWILRWSEYYPIEGFGRTGVSWTATSG
ncbi:hypothetical protein FHK02_4386 [Spirosoma sp. LMG 31448]|uniref:Uncharacterized protein n=1 Tax=Spirosoma utsteinense TaxID=2585773 RepID=A0ABR6WAP0_9BACT|nr:hypothetical protein [Spirosoma utsteinense]MBC3793640.1 hypothetical protein [Spirosoma utsteinense]